MITGMDAILGQDRAIDILQTLLSGDRMPHAFIFHGPQGVGKFTTAMAFARIRLCHHPERDLTGRVIACGGCPACRLFAASDRKNERDDDDDDSSLSSPHPDLHVVVKELCSVSSVTALRGRKQLNIPVDLLREHVVGGTSSDGQFHEAPAFKSAAMNHGKVFIIDEAELIVPYGQNVLLKTLEEPPAGTLLILVTSSEDMLLPTVRSRCQRIAFMPLSDKSIGQWLAGYDDSIAPDNRDWVIHFASGSIGRAKLAMDYRLFEWAREVLPMLDTMSRGGSPADLGGRIFGMINDFATAWVDSHKNASKDAANKMAAGLMWSMVARYARQKLWSISEQCTPSDPSASDRLMEPWLGVIDAIGEAQSLLATNVNMNMVCDQFVVELNRCLSGEVVTSGGGRYGR